jgi:hypothetical protein
MVDWWTFETKAMSFVEWLSRSGCVGNALHRIGDVHDDANAFAG